LRGSGQLVLRSGFILNAQNAITDFAAAIFHDRRLPVWVRFPQFFDQTSGKAILRQSCLEMVLALQLFRLLGGQVSFEKSFAWVILLRPNLASCQKN